MGETSWRDANGPGFSGNSFITFLNSGPTYPQFSY
jgi:hypothetical protein